MVWLIVLGSALIFALIFTPSKKAIIRKCNEVSENCEKNELECKKRMNVVIERIENENLPDVQEAYDFVMNHSKTKTINNSKKIHHEIAFGDTRNNMQFQHIMPEQSMQPEHVESTFIAAVSKSKSIHLLGVMREVDKTVKVCLAAVKRHGIALRYVPEKLKSSEICFAAVRQNGLALEFVPNELKTPELCLLAVQRDGDALYHVPDELQTLELFDAISPSEWHDQIDLESDNDGNIKYDGNDYGRYAYGEFNEFGFRIEK